MSGMSTTPSDRTLLIEYFADIDDGDLIALPPSGNLGEQDDGHDLARRMAAQRGIADPSWVFWHTQAGASFDSSGNLVEALRLNWGGDHDLVARALRNLPKPLTARSTGAGGVFLVERSDAADLAAAPYPALDDPTAVKSRIRRITAHGNVATEVDWAWLNTVLEHGDTVLQGAVVRYLAGSSHLTDGALEAVMRNWVSIYAKAPTDVLIWSLLRTLDQRQDPRLAEVIAAAAKRTRWTFYSGVSHFLEERGGPEHEELLYTLAQRPGRYDHTAGDAPAIRAWLKVRSAASGRAIEDLVSEALADPGFDGGARRALADEAQRAQMRRGQR